MDSVLAKRYASALYETAKSQTLESTVHEQLQLLLKLIKENKELGLFFTHPRIDPSTQKEIIKTLSIKDFNPLLIQFLNLLIEKKRLALIEPVIHAYEETYYEKNNIVKVKITSAFALSQEQLHLLVSKLKNKIKKDLVPEVSVDQSLLGGLKINIQDKIMDFSLASQLKIFHSMIIHA